MGDEGTSLIKLDGLAAPATLLIEKLSAATGVLLRPWIIKRDARAEGEAALIRAQSELEVDALKRRALERFVSEEARRQQNIEAIVQEALPHLSADADATKTSDDWMSLFMDRCRLVSDEHVRGLWAKLLAGQVNHNGSFSRRVIDVLSSMDASDAKLLVTLGRLTWVERGQPIPLVFDAEERLYSNVGINHETLLELEAVGLISYLPLGYRFEDPRNGWDLSYFGRRVRIHPSSKHLNFGCVTWTRAGVDLYKLSSPEMYGEAFTHTVELWRKEELVVDILE